MSALVPEPRPAWDGATEEAAVVLLRQAFLSAQLGRASPDMETAVESLWIILEALLVDHLADGGEGGAHTRRPPTPIGSQWSRLVTTAVTHTFVLSGVFVMPDDMLAAVERRAEQMTSGSLWHTRRPPSPGALVLGVHAALLRLEATASAGAHPEDPDAEALVDIVALGTLGAVRAGDATPVARPKAVERPSTLFGGESAAPSGRWARTPRSVAEAFGIPEVQLVEAMRRGWACDECGCVFAGRVEAGVAYPDRLAPVGRVGPCDATTDCACHAAPVQRRLR